MISARRATLALALGLAAVLAPASPSAADAPTPTNYRSEVLRVEPALPEGVTVEVVGGDSFLELEVTGHEAVVPDYGDAGPYLRFRADGTVERNRLAVATSANEDRFGTSDVEPDPDAEPVWDAVATDGRFAWHDHRIHWMSPTPPRAVDEDGRVDLGGPQGLWQVPLTVDGIDTVVIGQLWLLDSPPWWPPLLAGAMVTAAVVTLGRRRPRAASAVALVTAAAAVGASAATATALPAGISGSWVPLAVSGTAAGSSVVMLATDRWALVTRVATASALVGWGLVRADVLTKAVVPTVLPAWGDRAATVAALAVGVATATLVLLPPEPAPGARSAVQPPEPATH